MSIFQSFKLFLVGHLHLAKDALHIYVAVIAFLASCLLFGWRASQWRPLLVVLGLAMTGELWDLRDQLKFGDPIAPAEHFKDILNTLAVPILIWTAARYSDIFRNR